MSNYLKRVMGDFEKMSDHDKRPGFIFTEIRHDDWCGYFKGNDCNCDPEITYTRIEVPDES